MPTPTMPSAMQPSGAVAGNSSPAAPTNGFNAGSGEMQPDGKTVIYRIPPGTTGNWNPADKPIRVKRGWTLRFIDEARDGHWLHTNGQPCPHGLRAIGDGFDCVISQRAPFGVVSGVYQHNVAVGLGRVFIEVVE
jgi:hypothetical protein